MALTRAQLLAGDSSLGVVLPGQVQGVKQGIGVQILPDGTINFDASTATGIMRLNNPSAYNAYVWPTLAGVPAAGTILQSDGAGNLSWASNYVPTTSPTGAANLPVGSDAQRPSGVSLIAGQIRYNSQQGVLEFFDGVDWVTVVTIDPTPGPSPTVGLGLVVSGTAIKVSIPIQFGPPAAGTLPAEAVDGSMYWDDNLGLLFIRYNDGTSTQWVQVVPTGGGGGGGSYTGTAPIAVTGTAISLNIGLGNVANGGFLKANTPVQTGPPVAGTGQLQAIDGSLYWDNTQGLLFVRYNDGTSTQWVQVTPSSPTPAGYSGSFFSQSGQTVTVVNGLITSVA